MRLSSHTLTELETFKIFTRVTAKYPSALTGSSEELSYLGLGLSNEFFEYMEKRFGYFPVSTLDLKSELGDTIWYVVRLFDALKLEFPQDVEMCGTAEVLLFQVNCGVVQGVLKKVLRDGINVSADGTPRKKLASSLGKCLAALALLARWHFWTVEEVLDYNQRKLSDRVERHVLLGSGDDR